MTEPAIWFQCAGCGSSFSIDLEFVKGGTRDELRCPVCHHRGFSHVNITGFGDD